MQGERQPTSKDRRKGKYVRPLVVGIGLVLVLALLVNGLLSTPEKALAAFDTARAVADEDNAALIYAELLRGQEVVSFQPSRQLEAVLDPVFLHERYLVRTELVELELPQSLLDSNDDSHTLRHPWRTAEYPELRQWLDTHQARIDRLLEAARKPACWFPLSPRPKRVALFEVPLGAFRQNVIILRRAANNNMGEGSITAGLVKYQALRSIGRHMMEQPAASHLEHGIACEVVGLRGQITFVVTGSATERHLDALAAGIGDLETHWESVRNDVVRVRDLFSQTLKDHRSFVYCVSNWFGRIRRGQSEWWLKDSIRTVYHRMLCERRALHILIELRRFRNRTGHWPKRLDEVAPALPPLALVDPQNNGSYVYERTDKGFRLYSTGPNARDEGGQYAWRGPDDWPIWPPRVVRPESKPADANDV